MRSSDLPNDSRAVADMILRQMPPEIEFEGVDGTFVYWASEINHRLEGEELQDSCSHFSKVKAVDTENPDEYTQQQCHQPLAPGKTPGICLAIQVSPFPSTTVVVPEIFRARARMVSSSVVSS